MSENSDVLERLYRSQVLRWEHEDKTRVRHETGAIDKSGLVINALKRIRDEPHLKYIASLPCLVCGRILSQAHHLRFAQPRAMGKKVSDEYVVPLCVLHHRALHDVGSEETWWQEHHIDALTEAEKFWRQSHPVEAPVLTEATAQPAPSASAINGGSN